MILGLAGFLPVHPRQYLIAYRNRKLVNEAEKNEEKNEEPNEEESKIKDS